MAPIASKSSSEWAASAFSISNQYFAAAVRTVDRFKVRIWDTQTNTLKFDFSDNRFATITSFAWGRVDFSSESKSIEKESEERKKKIKRSAGEVLAIGALDGSISIFSISHGSIVSNFSNGHKNAVTGINFDLNRSQLFSCDVDGSVCQWDLKNGSMVASWKAPSSSSLSDICIFGDLLIGGSFSMFVWNLKDKSLKQEHVGHVNVIRKISCGKKYIFSAAEQENFVQVWRTKQSTQVATLMCETVINQIGNYGDSVFAAVGAGGHVYFWHPSVQIRKENCGSIKWRSSLKIDDEDRNGIFPIHSASLTSKDQVLICYGNAEFPRFENVSIRDDSGNLHDIVLYRKSENPKMHDEHSKSERITIPYDDTHAEIFGPEDLPSAPVPHKAVDDVQSKDELNRLMNEGTIADRMKTLQFEPNGRFEKEAPKADSLHQMLVQALHSGDSSLLESCLQNTDNRVIERTVQRLPSAYIMALVDNLYTRCRTTPGRTYQLSKWLRALLMTHMAYLMTLPNVVEVLAPLYQLLESRVAHHGQLLRLQGRLDVLEKQIRMRSAANNSVEDHSMLESPVVVYDENEEWSENDSLNSDEGLQLVEELDIAAVESSDHDDERN